MIGTPARQKGGPTSPWAVQLPVRHTFSLSQRTLLFSRSSLGHGRGPRARGRCSVTHAPSFLRITYLYLELVRARRVTRDRTDRTDRSSHICTIPFTVCSRARFEECDRAPIEGGPRLSLSWLFDRLHACRANPLYARDPAFSGWSVTRLFCGFSHCPSRYFNWLIFEIPKVVVAFLENWANISMIILTR